MLQLYQRDIYDIYEAKLHSAIKENRVLFSLLCLHGMSSVFGEAPPE